MDFLYARVTTACVDLVFFPVGVRRLELLDSSLLRADIKVGLLLQIMRNQPRYTDDLRTAWSFVVIAGR